MEGQQAQVKFGEWIEQGFQLFKENMLVLIIAMLLVMVIGGATMGILYGPMFAGMVLMALRLVDKKEPKPEIGDVFKGFDFFLPSFLFVLVWGVIGWVIGLILMLIPFCGLFLNMAFSLAMATFLMFGIFLIADRKMEFWPASLASINVVKTNFFPFLGFFIVVALIAEVGFVACCIGIFVTAPLMPCIMAVAYRDVFGSGSNAGLVNVGVSGASAPGSG